VDSSRDLIPPYPLPLPTTILGPIQAFTGSSKNDRLHYEIRRRNDGEHFFTFPFLDAIPGLPKVHG
jgi:hypothetical protein